MKDKFDKSKFTIHLVIYLGILFMGIVIGMLLQQLIIQASLVKVAMGLEGTNIEINVDINETILVDRVYENLGLSELNLTEELVEEQENKE